MSQTIEQTAAVTPPAPRAWTFLDKESGDPLTFTCMPGCVIRHDVVDENQKRDPRDVRCWTSSVGASSLPVDSTGKPEDHPILATFIEVEPFAATVAGRVPHAVIEIVADHYVNGLDPEALAVVIGVLEERLDALRRTHTELVRMRSETPDGFAVSRAWDAIETVFEQSENPEMTRKALREFVDMTAAKATPEVQA